MSKTFDDNGTVLKYLLGKIKSAFVSKTDVETIHEVRVDTTPTTNSQALVTSGGVKAALDGKVGKGGNETINGKKTFTVSPAVPTPTSATDAANKAYVDNHHDSTAVHKTGDETISGEKIFTGCFGIGDHIYYDGERLDFDGVNPTGLQNPVDDMDAVNKEYVDTGLNGKANDSQVVKIVAQSLTSANQLQVIRNLGFEWATDEDVNEMFAVSSFNNSFSSDFGNNEE